MYGGVYPQGIFAEVSAQDMLDANPPVNFERNTRNMIAAANANGVDMLLLTYAIYRESGWYKASSVVYKNGTAEHNEITRKVAEDTGVYFFDFAAIFPEKNHYFADGRHMTAEGNNRRAREVGAYIIENILSVEDDS